MSSPRRPLFYNPQLTLAKQFVRGSTSVAVENAMMALRQIFRRLREF